MEKMREGRNKAIVTTASLLRKGWLNIILFIVAVIIIGVGAYLGSQTHLAKRSDVNWYNQGVSIYNLPEELLPTTDDRPSEYPNIRAAVYLQQAILESKDDNIKALAHYNLGTLMGKDALAIVSGHTPRFSLTEAISNLAEATRINPSNENAKYNLELIQKVQSILTPQSPPIIVPVAGFSGGGAGYSGGAVHKGY